MKIRIHINKHRIKDGLPWTLHTSSGCCPASGWSISPGIGVCSLEEPHRKSNPKYFVLVHGKIKWVGNKAIITPE